MDFGYSTTAIEPYFDKNIFENRNTDKSFYLWDKNHEYYTNKEMLENKADVYVISTFYMGQYIDVIRELEDEGYEKHIIKGYTYIKDRKSEVEAYIVYTSPID